MKKIYIFVLLKIRKKKNNRYKKEGDMKKHYIAIHQIISLSGDPI
jgi:hypothetical protein